MSAQKFSKLEALKFGWNTTLHNLLFFVGVLVIINIVPLFTEMIDFFGAPFSVVVLFNIFSAILGIIFALGVIGISLQFAKGEGAAVADLFSKAHLFFKYLFAYIIFAVVGILGFILFIIPGIIWSVRTQLYAYFIVEEGAGPIEAIKKSWHVTKGSFWNLFLFGFLMVGVQLLGLLALVIGLVVAVPTTWVAWAFVYRKLRESQPQVQILSS